VRVKPDDLNHYFVNRPTFLFAATVCGACSNEKGIDGNPQNIVGQNIF
jgi:hypothetical protein